MLLLGTFDTNYLKKTAYLLTVSSDFKIYQYFWLVLKSGKTNRFFCRNLVLFIGKFPPWFFKHSVHGSRKCTEKIVQKIEAIFNVWCTVFYIVQQIKRI